jgi:hypothetical protein
VTSALGQNPKNSNRVYVFPCSSNDGHLDVLPCRLQPAGSTISNHGLQNCARMNVTSVFDLFGWTISGGGLFVFTDSQNRPHTHPCHPRVHMGSTRVYETSEQQHRAVCGEFLSKAVPFGRPQAVFIMHRAVSSLCGRGFGIVDLPGRVRFSGRARPSGSARLSK